jgi:cytochrome c peroxidase
MGRCNKKIFQAFNISCVCLALIYSGLASAGSSEKDLLNQAEKVFSALPKEMASEKNPITAEKVSLGKMLFYETRISVDGTVSCARCHPMGLYAVDGLKKSIGNNCKLSARNAPTLFNSAGQISAHWTGNRVDVEDQAKQALIGPPSFGMPSYEAAENKLKEIEGYVPLFEKAFPGEEDPVSADNFAKAIGAFERTLVTPSPFDSFLKGKQGSLTAPQKNGLKTFMETGCTSCHSGAYVGGQMYRKFGVAESYWQYTRSQDVDEGRYTVTRNEGDKYVFKVPVLRNVEMTSPYFHDGSIDSLLDAVFIMGKVQLARTLTAREIDDIVFFLGALTGRIPGEALSVPLLPRWTMDD